MRKIAKSLIILTLILITTPIITNAGEYKQYRRDGSMSVWKGYKGEQYYNYWYGPCRPLVKRRGIVSGGELRRPMGDYPTTGYFGGYRINPDGTRELWSYETGD